MADSDGSSPISPAARAAHWRELLKREPDNAPALNAVGSWELGQGHAEAALDLLRRANALDPGQPALLFNLAAAQQALGLRSEAIGSLRLALAADPYFVQAMFQIAVLYEEAGDIRSAAEAYRNVIAAAPPEVMGSPRFAPALARAKAAVVRDAAALDAVMGAARAGPSARIAEAIDVLVGRSKIYRSEPTFLPIPRLPAIPFLDRDDTPWIDGFEAWADQIMAEVAALLDEGAEEGFQPYIAHPAGAPLNQWDGLDRSRRWSAFHLWRHGELVADHAARLPATMAALAKLPLLTIDGRGPNAFLSMLEPGTRIPPHTGVTNARLTVHLPLIVPSDCGFRVGSETRYWEPGRAWVFDDTIEHEAWNDSDRPRLILICDIWHPMLSIAEREQVAALLAAYDRHYGSDRYSIDGF